MQLRIRSRAACSAVLHVSAICLLVVHPSWARSGLSAIEELGSVTHDRNLDLASQVASQRREAQHAPDGTLASWRRYHRQLPLSGQPGGDAQAVRNPVAFLEMASPDAQTEEELRAAVAADILRAGYGFGSSGTLASAADAAATSQQPAAAREATVASPRFAAAPLQSGAASRDQPHESSDSNGHEKEHGKEKAEGESEGLKVAKEAGTAAMKLGSSVATFWSKRKAAKAAAKPKPDQCVMCIYSVERLQQELAPHYIYRRRYDKDRGDRPLGLKGRPAGLVPAGPPSVRWVQDPNNASLARPVFWTPLNSAYAAAVPAGQLPPLVTEEGRLANLGDPAVRLAYDVDRTADALGIVLTPEQRHVAIEKLREARQKEEEEGAQKHHLRKLLGHGHGHDAHGHEHGHDGHAPTHGPAPTAGAVPGAAAAPGAAAPAAGAAPAAAGAAAAPADAAAAAPPADAPAAPAADAAPASFRQVPAFRQVLSGMVDAVALAQAQAQAQDAAASSSSSSSSGGAFPAAPAAPALSYPWTSLSPGSFPTHTGLGLGSGAEGQGSGAHPDAAPALLPRPAIHDVSGGDALAAFPSLSVSGGANAFAAPMGGAAAAPLTSSMPMPMPVSGFSFLELATAVGEATAHGSGTNGVAAAVPAHLRGDWYAAAPSLAEALHHTDAASLSTASAASSSSPSPSSSSSLPSPLRAAHEALLAAAAQEAYAALAAAVAGDDEARAHGEAALAALEQELTSLRLRQRRPADLAEAEAEADVDMDMVPGHWSGSVFVPEVDEEHVGVDEADLTGADADADAVSSLHIGEDEVQDEVEAGGDEAPRFHTEDDLRAAAEAMQPALLLELASTLHEEAAVDVRAAAALAGLRAGSLSPLAAYVEAAAQEEAESQSQGDGDGDAAAAPAAAEAPAADAAPAAAAPADAAAAPAAADAAGGAAAGGAAPAPAPAAGAGTGAGSFASLRSGTPLDGPSLAKSAVEVLRVGAPPVPTHKPAPMQPEAGAGAAHGTAHQAPAHGPMADQAAANDALVAALQHPNAQLPFADNTGGTGLASGGSVWRDFAGEDAVFGPHPFNLAGAAKRSSNRAALLPRLSPGSGDLDSVHGLAEAAHDVAALTGVVGNVPLGPSPLDGSLPAQPGDRSGKPPPTSSSSSSKSSSSKSSSKAPANSGPGSVPFPGPPPPDHAPAAVDAVEAEAAMRAPPSQRDAMAGSGGTVTGGEWLGGGDVPTQGSRAQTTEDVWWGDAQADVIAPGYVPAGSSAGAGAAYDMRAFMPSAVEAAAIKARGQGAWQAGDAFQDKPPPDPTVAGLQLAARGAEALGGMLAQPSPAAAPASSSSGGGFMSKLGGVASMASAAAASAGLGDLSGALSGLSGAASEGAAAAAAAAAGGITEAVVDAARRANNALYRGSSGAKVSDRYYMAAAAAAERRRAGAALLASRLGLSSRSSSMLTSALGSSIGGMSSMGSMGKGSSMGGMASPSSGAGSLAAASPLPIRAPGPDGFIPDKFGKPVPFDQLTVEEQAIMAAAREVAARSEPPADVKPGQGYMGGWVRGEAPLGNKAVERIFAKEGLAGALDADAADALVAAGAMPRDIAAVAASLVGDARDAAPSPGPSQVKPMVVPPMAQVPPLPQLVPHASPDAAAAAHAPTDGSAPPADAAAAVAAAVAEIAHEPAAAAAPAPAPAPSPAAKPGFFSRLFGRKSPAPAPAPASLLELQSSIGSSSSSSNSHSLMHAHGEGRAAAAAATGHGHGHAHVQRNRAGKGTARRLAAEANAEAAAAALAHTSAESEAVAEAEADAGAAAEAEAAEAAHAEAAAQAAADTGRESESGTAAADASAEAEAGAAAAAAEAEAEDAIAGMSDRETGADADDVTVGAAAGRLQGSSARFAAEGQGQGQGQRLPPLLGKALKMGAQALGLAAPSFPLPHSCPPGQELCAQRHRQPSLMDVYRRLRRDQQRAAMNRALLSYSLALDRICLRDSAGLDTEVSRDAPLPESVMAGYPQLASETHRREGHFEDQWAYLKVTTRHGDRVGIGSFRHYALPDPFRAFCPKLRAKLAIVVERLLHGYDEEEVCFALKMCDWTSVRVWRPGPPTSGGAAISGAMAALKGKGEAEGAIDDVTIS